MPGVLADFFQKATLKNYPTVTIVFERKIPKCINYTVEGFVKWWLGAWHFISKPDAVRLIVLDVLILEQPLPYFYDNSIIVSNEPSLDGNCHDFIMIR